MASSEKIGTFEARRFYNDESSFLIGIFTNHETKETFTAKGVIVKPELGLTYKLTGEMEENQYGEQLNFSAYETMLPKDPQGIFKYIVRICKFVGNKVGTDIVEAFGEETLDIMKSDPVLLSSNIKGITLERAIEISETLSENEANEAVMVELETLLNVPGLRKALPAELIKKFKSNAAAVIKDNPYILTEFNGVSFVLADRVAMDIKYSSIHINRRKAAVIHAIKEEMQSGSVWMLSSQLIKKTEDLTLVMGAGEAIEVLLDEQLLVKRHSCCDGLCFYAFSHDADKEGFIALKLAKLMAFEIEDVPVHDFGGEFDDM